MVEPLACCLHGVERAEVRGATRRGHRRRPDRPDAVRMRRRRRRPPGSSAAGPATRARPRFGGVSGDGAGADVVIEAAGTVEAWQSAVELVRPGGTVVAFGGLPVERARRASTRIASTTRS